MSIRAAILAICFAAGCLHAQASTDAPRSRVEFAGEDSAAIYVAAARAIADSLALRYPRKHFQLELDLAPRDTRLQDQLRAAVPGAVHIWLCGKVKHCGHTRAPVVRLGPVYVFRSDSVWLNIEVDGDLNVAQASTLDWTPVQWDLAAKMGLFLDLQRPLRGGCTEEIWRAFALQRDSGGVWKTVGSTSFRLCA